MPPLTIPKVNTTPSANQVAASGGSSYVPNNAQGYGGMNLAPAGVKASVPGGTNSTQTNALKSTYTAPSSQQKVTSGASNIGSYKGIPITPGTDAEVAAQIAHIDATQATKPVQPTQINAPQSNAGGSTGALLQQAQANPSQYSNIVNQLQQISTQGNPQVQAAQDALKNFQTGMAHEYVNIAGQPIPLVFQQGRKQAVQQAAGLQEQALSQNVQNALAAQQQELTGLGTAAGLAKPELGAIGQVPYSPLDLSQGNILGTTQAGGVQAAGNLLGQLQGAQAAGAAPGQATASNINTQQTAQINALASVYGQNAPAAYQLNNSLNNIQSLGALTLQTAQGGNINPLTVQAGNQTIADFRRQLGSSSQAAFDSNMANFQSALTGIYADQSGAIPTQVTAWGQAIANGSMPISQLQAIYQQAINEGGLRLGNLKATAGSAYSGLQGSPVTGNAGGASSGALYTSNSGNTYRLPY